MNYPKSLLSFEGQVTIGGAILFLLLHGIFIFLAIIVIPILFFMYGLAIILSYPKKFEL